MYFLILLEKISFKNVNEIQVTALDFKNQILLKDKQ